MASTIFGVEFREQSCFSLDGFDLFVSESQNRLGSHSLFAGGRA